MAIIEDNDPNQRTVNLYSYHCPSLLSGKYKVSVDHDIVPPDTSKAKKWISERTFSIVGPRFSIPVSDVNSIYPIQGQREEPRVLPHVVFNSPHLPWENAIDHRDGNKDITRTPWMALIPFTKDELHNSLIDLDASNLPALTSTLAYETTLSYITEKHTHTLCPNISSGDAFSEEEKKHPVSFISLTPEKFLQLFDSQDAPEQAQHTLTLERFKYFAHARTLNVQGTTLHPIVESERHKSFGVVTSHRCAPLNIDKEETIYVHLVSLEGLKHISASQGKITAFETSKVDDVQRISLVSLKSWTYQALPPKKGSFAELLDSLNDTKQPLRRSDPELKNLNAGTGPKTNPTTQKWLAARLANGYTFVHHRTYSGERTTAIYRGPLIPSPSSIHRALPSQTGMDLQILDSETGMMDISYSVAWELGRTLASADRAYTAALMRLRSECLHLAFLSDPSRKEKAFDNLRKLLEEKKLTGDMLRTFLTDSQAPYNLSVDTATVGTSSNSTSGARSNRAALEYGLATIVRKWLTDAVTAQVEKEGQKPLDQKSVMNTIPSTWALVLRWAKNKLMLNDIPTTHLFPDPAVLQEECLRTFYIDQSWLDAFLDGALSLADHTTYLKDPIKVEIKRSINTYLQQSVEKFGSEKATPPRWGFILRSRIIRAFPNLIIRQIRSDSNTSEGQPSSIAFMGQPVIHPLGDKTLMFLQSQTPEEPQKVTSIHIQQPHHHQRFSVGTELDSKVLKFTFNSYRGQDKPLEEKYLTVLWSPGSLSIQVPTEDGEPLEAGNPIFDWETRCILTRGFLEACANVPGIFPGPLGWQQVTSALCALQLNDGIHELRLDFANENKQTSAPTPRNLFNPGEEKKAPDPPAADKQPGPSPSTNTQPALVPVNAVAYGFDIEKLDKATHIGLEKLPDAPPAAPLAMSLLRKMCYPLLQMLGRNIPVPVPEPLELDLIFFIAAPRNVFPDVNLEYVTVSLPIGDQPTDLLQRVSARPSIRIIARTQRWTTRTWHDEKTKQLHIKLYPRTATKAQPDIPLHEATDLSFVLQWTQMQQAACNNVKIGVEEQYKYKGQPAKVSATLVVKKQKCDWVPLK